MLGETEMLRLVQAAQCCTEREYVDYNPPQKHIVQLTGNVWEDIRQMPKVRIIWRMKIWHKSKYP